MNFYSEALENKRKKLREKKRQLLLLIKLILVLLASIVRPANLTFMSYRLILSSAFIFRTSEPPEESI